MRKKNLIFYAVLSTFVLVAAQVSAVDMLDEEDESLIWDTHISTGDNTKDILFELTDGTTDEQGMVIQGQTLKVPSRGEPLYAVPVPEEVNARAVEYIDEEDEYEDPAIIRVRSDTPRSTMYPIGRERQVMKRSRTEDYDPYWRQKIEEKRAEKSRQMQIKAYKDAVDECVGGRKDELDMEIGLLNQGDLYQNTVYLSETMEAIEQCYDDLGLDIIENLYNGDNEVLRQYNRQVSTYQVKSSDATFNPKYCQENCSVSAVAALQMEKFGEFKDYLYELLDNAPEVEMPAPRPRATAEDEKIWLEGGQPAEAVMINSHEGYVATPAQGARPQVIRVRDINGKEQVVRWHENTKAQPTAAPEQRPVPRSSLPLFVDDDVPYIDDSEL